MRVPNAERAFIDTRKLATYCLDLTHPVDRHKAVVFQRTLGWTEKDADVLLAFLSRAIATCEAALGLSDEFGQCYAVDFPVTTPTGSATLRSAWILRADEDFPRFVTCYVLSD